MKLKKKKLGIHKLNKTFSPLKFQNRIFGDPLRLRDPLGDFDKDRVPNLVDCQPRNKKKQDMKAVKEKMGIFGRKVKKIARKVHKKYEKYKEEAPKREEAQIEKLQRQERMWAVKEQIAKHKKVIRPAGGGMGAFPIRLRTEEEKKKIGAAYDFGFGLKPKPVAVKKKRKKSRKAKKRVKKKRYIIME